MGDGVLSPRSFHFLGTEFMEGKEVNRKEVITSAIYRWNNRQVAQNDTAA